MYKFILLLTISCLGICTPMHALEKSSTLVVGTNAEFPPFTFISDREIVGFDIDMAKEVAKRMNKEIEIKDMSFDALLPSIALNDVDIIAAGMTITEERAKRALFTKPYHQGDPLVVVRLPMEEFSLSGKNIGVCEGYTHDLYLSTIPNVTLTRFSFSQDGFLALKTERIDAFVTAKSVTLPFFEKENPKNYQVDILEGTSENCAMLVSKKDPQLLKDIQEALDEMEKDGTISSFKTKWGLS